MLVSTIFTSPSVGVTIAFGSTHYFNAIQNVGRVKSFVDDLYMERGTVSMRVALVLRSAEVLPLFRDLCIPLECQFLPPTPVCWKPSPITNIWSALSREKWALPEKKSKDSPLLPAHPIDMFPSPHGEHAWSCRWALVPLSKTSTLVPNALSGVLVVFFHVLIVRVTTQRVVKGLERYKTGPTINQVLQGKASTVVASRKKLCEQQSGLVYNKHGAWAK
jgi:hypothetical protein